MRGLLLLDAAVSYGQNVGWDLRGAEHNSSSRKLSLLGKQLLLLLLLPGLLFASQGLISDLAKTHPFEKAGSYGGYMKPNIKDVNPNKGVAHC